MSSAEAAAPVAAPVPAHLRRGARLRALWPDIRALVAPRRGILATGMLLIIVSRAAALVSPAAVKLLIDDVLGAHRVDLLPRIVLVVAAAAVVQAGSSHALTAIFSRSSQQVVKELRCKLHAHVLRLPLLYHDESRSGALGSRIMNDVSGLQNLVGPTILGFVGTVLTAAIALAAMAWFHVGLAVLAFVCAVAATLIAGSRTGRAKDIAHERGDIAAELWGRLGEALGGIRVLKAYRAEERENAIFAAGADRLADISVRSSALTSRLSFATTLLWGLVNAVVLYAGARLILAGQLTLGGFVTASVLLNYLAAPALQVVGVGTMLMDALAGLERMRAILHEPPEDGDPGRDVAIGRLRGVLELDHVSFAYAPGRTVLHDVSFHAEPGTMTALVGPSGAGKSTIIGLASSFYTPTAGQVRVDGVDLARVELGSYRKQIGVVLQETFLFAGTILDNIALGRPSATRDEIVAAARLAHVDEFAEALPEGYDTSIGERGVRLSGGQRQRISIARALLADPRIIILDEAMSSLDTRVEALVQEGLARLLEGRTTLVIAHRLSTIQRADQILVVDGGRIVERGTHAALAAAGGLYAEMWDRQQSAIAMPLFPPAEIAAPLQEAEPPESERMPLP